MNEKLQINTRKLNEIKKLILKNQKNNKNNKKMLIKKTNFGNRDKI